MMDWFRFLTKCLQKLLNENENTNTHTQTLHWNINHSNNVSMTTIYKKEFKKNVIYFKITQV